MHPCRLQHIVKAVKQCPRQGFTRIQESLPDAKHPLKTIPLAEPCRLSSAIYRQKPGNPSPALGWAPGAAMPAPDPASPAFKSNTVRQGVRGRVRGPGGQSRLPGYRTRPMQSPWCPSACCQLRLLPNKAQATGPAPAQTPTAGRTIAKCPRGSEAHPPQGAPLYTLLSDQETGTQKGPCW